MKIALLAVLAATIFTFPAFAAPCPVFQSTMTEIEQALDAHEALAGRRAHNQPIRIRAPYTPAEVLVTGRKSHPSDTL